MHYSNSLAFIGLALAAPAFAFVSPSSVASRSHSSLGATRDPNNERATPDAIRNLAAVSALALGLFFPSTDALAAQGTASQLNDHALYSSTVELSKELKTMDFSMPSSYDNIVAPVAAGVEELSTTTVLNTGAPKRVKKAAVEKGSSPKEDAATQRAERVAQRKLKEDEQAARDEVSAGERDANIKAARVAKIAAREAAQAEKDAAASDAKDDAKFKGAKFVDTSMPSY